MIHVLYRIGEGKLSKDEFQQFGFESGVSDAFGRYLIDNRTPVSEDNTTLSQLKGDFAVPTLFNGNFDAIAQLIPSQPTPGWSLTGSGQVRPNQSGNFSFELNNNSSLEHQSFVVPEWGAFEI